MRPKIFDMERTLDAAMQIFWQKGYAATSIQDLVDGTGLGRGSLYHAFDSKHGLYEQALRRYHALTQPNIALLSESGPIKALIEKLLLSIVADELSVSPRSGCMAANASLELAGQDEVVAKLVTHNFGRLEKALEGALLRGQAAGEIDSHKQAAKLARFILNTIQGLRVLGKDIAYAERKQRLLDVVEVTLSAL